MKLFRVSHPNNDYKDLVIAAKDEWEALDIVESDNPEYLGTNPKLRLADLYVEEVGFAPTGVKRGITDIDTNKVKVTEKRPGARWQTVREISTNTNYGGERSPYWDFVVADAHKRGSDGMGSMGGAENPRANPDVHSDEDAVYSRPLSGEGRSQIETIEDIIRVLPPQQRRVVELCAIEGLTLQEAAEQLDLSVKTVHGYLVRARAKIQAAYKDSDKS